MASEIFMSAGPTRALILWLERFEMRELFVIALIGIGIWYFTIGVRIGLVGTWPTTLVNAKGTNNYSVTILRDGNTVTIKGTCTTWSGKVEIYLQGPRGQVLGSAVCSKGTQSLNIVYIAVMADYNVQVKMESYSGRLDFTANAL
ncbi:MAG: hypothetical protein H7095_01080 [Pseudopedobacter sp.]|nr:hypothetical protein [Deinococcales bacterium]